MIVPRFKTGDRIKRKSNNTTARILYIDKKTGEYDLYFTDHIYSERVGSAKATPINFVDCHYNHVTKPLDMQHVQDAMRYAQPIQYYGDTPPKPMFSSEHSDSLYCNCDNRTPITNNAGGEDFQYCTNCNIIRTRLPVFFFPFWKLLIIKKILRIAICI